jgi:AcrR family transcriptional regulator
MARTSARRDALAEAATDYALEHGLIDLSLRPLAAAVGTSDRMLLYHFEDKHDLVAAILRVSNDRSVAEIRALTPARSVRRAVADLWSACAAGQLDRCQRLYVQAAALGLLGREPYLSVVRESNQRWVDARTDYLVQAGATRARAGRAVALLDAAFMGLQLDLALEPGPAALRRTVRDLTNAVVAITG